MYVHIGDNLGTIIVNQHAVRPIQRSLPSTTFLFPYSDPTGTGTYGWRNEEVLIMTPHRNYTRLDYQQFFIDMGFPQGYLMYKDSEDVLPALGPPGVELFCIFGTGLSTPELFQYTARYPFPDSQPYLLSGIKTYYLMPLV